jgi:hypothetical protein
MINHYLSRRRRALDLSSKPKQKSETERKPSFQPPKAKPKEQRKPPKATLY